MTKKIVERRKRHRSLARRLVGRLSRFGGYLADMRGVAKTQGWAGTIWTFIAEPLWGGWEWSPGMILERTGRVVAWTWAVLWRDIDFDGLSLTQMMIYKLSRLRLVLAEGWPTRTAGPTNNPEYAKENERWEKIHTDSLAQLDLAIDLLRKSGDWSYAAGIAKNRGKSANEAAVQQELREQAFAIIAKNMDCWWH